MKKSTISAIFILCFLVLYKKVQGSSIITFDSIYFINLAYKIDSNTVGYSRLFVNVRSARDRKFFDSLNTGNKNCGDLFDIKDSFFSVLNRNEVFLPLMSYEVANIKYGDTNAFKEMFGHKIVMDTMPRSHYFYSTVCYTHLDFHCRFFAELEGMVITKVRKLRIRGIQYEIPVDKYISEYSFRGESEDYKYHTNTVFFRNMGLNIYRSYHYLPQVIYDKKYLNSIWVIDAEKIK